LTVHIFPYGQVHYDLATYNYIGRFTDNQPDFESTKYHLEKAAMSGSMQANKILGFKYSLMTTEEFGELILDVSLFVCLRVCVFSGRRYFKVMM